MRRISALSILIGCIIVLGGCGTAPAASGGDVDIRGEITSVAASTTGQPGDPLGHIQIEGVLAPDTAYDRAAVAITAQTRIVRQQDDTQQPAAFADFTTGQRVEARFTGPVMESYPVQATASEVVILP